MLNESIAFTHRFPTEHQVHGHHNVTMMTRHFYGFLRFQDQRLVLDWATTTELMRVSAGAVLTETVHQPSTRTEIPIRLIASIGVRRPWPRPWQQRLEVRVSDLETLASVPAAERGQLVLPIASGERTTADRLAMGVRLAMADALLDELEPAMDELPEVAGTTAGEITSGAGTGRIAG